jgi:hypothetical protein
MLTKSGAIDQIAKALAQSRGSSKKGSGTPEPFVSTCSRRTPASHQPQDLPRGAGVLPANPLNGSRVCLARRLWSSQIFCDSATEVS